ncbi:hypothetical protein PCE1_004681 [Barthelona sp. PCE]
MEQAELLILIFAVLLFLTLVVVVFKCYQSFLQGMDVSNFSTSNKKKAAAYAYHKNNNTNSSQAQLASFSPGSIDAPSKDALESPQNLPKEVLLGTLRRSRSSTRITDRDSDTVPARGSPRPSGSRLASVYFEK